MNKNPLQELDNTLEKMKASKIIEDYEKKIYRNAVERCCDVCSTLFLQEKDSDTAGKNGQWEKVFLCPRHQGITRNK